MRILKIVMIIFAVIIGLYPGLYFIFERTFGLLSTKSPDTLSSILWNTGFYIHIILGGLALFIGWIQFLPNLRNRYRSFHVLAGKVYIISVLLSGFAGFYIAFYATGGWISSLGFMGLAAFWILSTVRCFTYIQKGNLVRHQQMATYSYALCFSAVTLRIWLPLLVILLKDFNQAYSIVAWLCWIPNLWVAYWINHLESPALSDAPSLQNK